MNHFVLNKLQTDVLYHIANAMEVTVGEVVNTILRDWILKTKFKIDREALVLKRFVKDVTL